MKFLSAIFMALPAVVCAAPAFASDFAFLPRKKLFAPFIADPQYPVFAVRYSMIAGGANRAEINMGDEFALVSSRLSGGATVQFGIMGGVAARFNISEITNDFEIADFTLAFPFDYSLGPWALRAMYWHTSSHIGDDFIKGGAIAPQLLSKHVTDELRFYASYNPAGFLRVYAGPGYAFNLIPSTGERWRLHGGAEARTSGRPVSLFAAADLQSLQRNGWNPSFTARTGVRREGPTSAASVWCEFFSGRLPYLGFMAAAETKWSLGFGFEM